MAQQIKGIIGSRGIAVAPLYLIQKKTLVIPNHKITNVSSEINQLEHSYDEINQILKEIKADVLKRQGADKAAIFEAHLMILNDPSMKSEIITEIEAGNNLAASIAKITTKYYDTFRNMEDTYFQERAADVKDIANRWLHLVLNVPQIDLSKINQEVIVVAVDLTPSETIQLKPEFIKGIVCAEGGATSHAAFLASNLKIPAILGIGSAIDKLQHQQWVVLDGLVGHILYDISEAQIAEWQKKKVQYEKTQQELIIFRDRPTLSADKIKFEVEANIGGPDDLAALKENGAEGVGLFRTEFLYMDNDHFPTEEEQYREYSQILRAVAPHKVICRTLDIGGDKQLSYYKFREELNPFLGERAIRFGLAHQKVLMTQLKALIRAGTAGNLWIMFPMIATIKEIIAAKKIAYAAKAELEAANIATPKTLKIGMMIEIPSSVLLIEQFSQHVDFFSIGTNDLIQYTYAADRMNPAVSYLYQPLDPGILRFINMAVTAARKNNKPIGMCGAVAGDPLVVPLLVGMGLEMFSVSPNSVLSTRKIISETNQTKVKPLLNDIFALETGEAVQAFLTKKGLYENIL